MAKPIVSASARREFLTKILSDNVVSIETLRKPLKKTATQKRRALKKSKAEDLIVSRRRGPGPDIDADRIDPYLLAVPRDRSPVHRQLVPEGLRI